MPLSDHEQRLLDEIEQALYAEDPKFVSSVRSVRARSGRRRVLIWGGIGVLMGLGLVLVGLVAALIPLAVVGFVLVVGAVSLVVQSLRARPETQARRPGTKGSAGAGSSSGGFRNRMEQRLHRRFDES